MHDGSSTQTPSNTTTGTTTTTTATGNNNNNSSSQSSTLEIDPQQLRHWASPEELLAIKNLLGDLRLNHKTEVQNLLSSLEAARAENDILRRDAQAFARLKDAYLASENDFQRMKSERAAWHEEREMLVIKMQQASNEILRLKQAGAAAGSASSQGRAPSSSSTGASSGATTTTSLGIFGGGGGDNNKYVLALAESEHRRECEIRELTSRLEFQQLTHDMSRQRMQQRVSAAEAELRVTKEKLSQLKERTRALQQQCDSAEVRFADLEGVAQRKIGEAEAELRAAREAKAAAERAERQAIEESEDSIAALEEQHKAKINEILQETTAQNATLTASLNRAVATAQRTSEAFDKEREQLLAELRDVNELLRMERAKGDNTAQQLSQRLQITTNERDELQGQLSEAQTECAKLRTRLDVCSDTIGALRNEIEELHSNAVRAHKVESALSVNHYQMQQLQTQRDQQEARAKTAEQQVMSLAAALERERSQSLLALELLQRQREEREAEIENSYRKQIERLDRKYRDTKIRVKELLAWREANEEMPARAGADVAASAASASAAPRADALETMQAQFHAASLLAKRSG